MCNQVYQQLELIEVECHSKGNLKVLAPPPTPWSSGDIHVTVASGGAIRERNTSNGNQQL
jgi:hypothetical protein